MNYLKFIFTFMLIFLFQISSAQQKINPDSIEDKMAWFEDAKLGIFIHWGIYAVADVSESWSFHKYDAIVCLILLLDLNLASNFL